MTGDEKPRVTYARDTATLSIATQYRTTEERLTHALLGQRRANLAGEVALILAENFWLR